MLASQTIFADELRQAASERVTRAVHGEAVSEDEEANLPVEAAAILRSFMACAENGLWSEAMEHLTLSDWQGLVSQLRPFALAHDEVVQAPKELARLVSVTAIFLRDRMPTVLEAAQVVPTASLQLTMSIMSLIRAKKTFETVRETVERERENADERKLQALKTFEDQFVAWCPCDNDELSERRHARCGLSPILRWVRKQIGDEAPLYFTALGGDRVLKDDAWLENVRLAQDADAPSHERMEACFLAMAMFPWAAQKQIISRMPDNAQKAWYGRMNILDAFEHCDAERAALRLSALSALETAFGALIRHDFSLLDTISTRDMPESLMAAWYVIRALSARMQGLPWEDTYLRQGVCVPPALSFWPGLPSVYFYLRAEALCARNAPEVALQELQHALQNELCDALICVAFAQNHTALAHFGEAQVWIARASEVDENKDYLPLIARTREKLASASLDAAKRSPVLDASLLELALDTGDAETFSDAALCWFDAEQGRYSWLGEKLASCGTGCRKFTAELLKRDELSHFDELCEIAEALENNASDDSARYDAQILQALSRLDCPEAAYERLICVVERWKTADKSRPDTNFWHAAERCITMGCASMAFDEVARTLAPELVTDSPQARQALRLLFALTPRQALPILQQALIETIGQDETLACFMRLKQPDRPEEPEKHETHQSCLPEILAPPLSWLIWARSGAILHPIQKPEKPSPREIARTLMRQKLEKMPEPPKAEWIHQTQKKASDAFDV